MSVEELAKVLPAFAHRFVHYPQADTERIAVSVLAVGDHVRVKPGELYFLQMVRSLRARNPSGQSTCLTGKVGQSTKQAGDDVIGGTINRGAPLIVRRKVGDSRGLRA